MNDIKQKRTPEVLVVGTGAVGGLYGAKLAQAGADVTVLCRSDYTTVKKNGLAIKSIWGDFHFTPKRVLSDLYAYGSFPDYLLICLKVLPDISVSQMIKGVVGPETAIVLLQNGVEIEDPVASNFTHNEIISGLAFVCVNRIGAGRIEHLDYGRLSFGRYPCGPSNKAVVLADFFRRSGVPCSLTENVVKARWKKLVWNAPFNSLSVLGGGVDTQMIINSEHSTHLSAEIMKEVCLIAESVGHPLSPKVIQQNLDDTRLMKPYKTSMLMDYELGRPMEIEAILGNALRAARRGNVFTPHLQTVYALLKLIESKSVEFPL